MLSNRVMFPDYWPLFSLGPSIVSAVSLMKVGGCYNVTGLPEYSSEIGFRVDRERREEQLLWAENI